MFYNFFASKGGHPTWEETFIEKNTKNANFFLNHTVNLINKSSEMLKNAATYTRLINMISFP